MALAFFGGVTAFFMLNKPTGLLFIGMGVAIIVIPNVMSMLVGLLDDLNEGIRDYLRG